MSTEMKSEPAYCIEFFYAYPNKRTELNKALKALAKQSLQEEGCLQYDVLQDNSNPDLFILTLKYSTAQLLEQHEKQPYVLNFSDNEMKMLCKKVTWHDATPIN